MPAKKSVAAPVSSKKSAAPAPKVAAKAPAAAVVASTPVRNSPVPKAVKAPAPAPAVAARKEISHADIAKRAYEIYASGQGGSEFDNWCRAERELRGL